MKKIVFLMIIILFIGIDSRDIFGEEISWQDNLDYSDVEEFINENMDNNGPNFENIVSELMKGDSDNVFENAFNEIKIILTNEIKYSSQNLKKVIIIIIFSAILTVLSSSFANKQIAETGFTISYMIIISLLLGSFEIMTGVAFKTINSLMEFMKSMLPVYMVSVGISEGQAGAAAIYKGVLIIIAIADFILLKIIIPGVNIYVVFVIINNISKEDLFSKASEMTSKIISFLMKSIISVVIGINVIQAMLIPISGGLKNTAAKSIVSILGGSQGMASNIAGLLYGTGTMIKNSIGVAGLIIIIVIVSVPAVKIIVFVTTYQMANVFMQPISDKRITACVDGVTNGGMMLLRAVFLSAVLLIITIAVICLTTGMNKI